jgi:spermidine/putrescine transport system substrate-binding protein
MTVFNTGGSMATRWNRREFLQRSAALAAIGGSAGTLLEACGSSSSTGTGAVNELIGTPAKPVTLPIASDNAAIKDGLQPENGTLTVLNYVDYVSPDVIKAFEKQFNVKVQITTFDSDSALIDKLRNGALKGDLVMSAAYNSFYKLIAAKILQPLNHSYLPNISNLVPAFQDPFYDKGSRYTVPYTVYGVGLDYRTDKVTAADLEAKSWGIVWDTQYKGYVSVLNDYREALSLALLRKGITDVNTTDAALIAQAGADLKQLTSTNNVKVTIEGYKNVPEGTTYVAEGYSGDMINGLANLPKGTDPGVLGFWRPKDGKFLVNNDCMCILRGAGKPALAHAFLNYILDVENAATNFSTNGYQPPLSALSVDELIKRKLVPETLRSTVLSADEIAHGLRLLGLPLAAEQLWTDAYSKFNSGG